MLRLFSKAELPCDFDSIGIQRRSINDKKEKKIPSKSPASFFFNHRFVASFNFLEIFSVFHIFEKKSEFSIASNASVQAYKRN